MLVKVPRFSAGGDEAARNRHLEFYVALAEEAESELTGREQRAGFARIDQERENLLAANAWCDHANNGAELGLQLVFGLRLYLVHRGLIALEHRLATEALARPGACYARRPCTRDLRPLASFADLLDRVLDDPALNTRESLTSELMGWWGSRASR